MQISKNVNSDVSKDSPKLSKSEEGFFGKGGLARRTFCPVNGEPGTTFCDVRKYCFLPSIGFR